MKKEDWVFIISPFILTWIFLTIGYLILIRQTPEAKIGIFESGREDEVILLEEKDMRTSPRAVEVGSDYVAFSATLPQNYLLVDRIIERAKSQKAQVIFINIPVKFESDSYQYFEQAELSSQVNVLRWLRQTIAILHEEDFAVVVNLTLNSAVTITDPALFAHSYAKLVQPVADVLQETQVRQFFTGITVGHPIYSKLQVRDVSRIMATVKEKAQERYVGRLGYGFCCTDEFELVASGFDGILLIPTPEYGYNKMLLQVDEYLKAGLGNQVLYLDRDRPLVLTQMP